MVRLQKLLSFGRFTGLLQKTHKNTHFQAYIISADCKLF